VKGGAKTTVTRRPLPIAKRELIVSGKAILEKASRSAEEVMSGLMGGVREKQKTTRRGHPSLSGGSE